MTSIAATSCTQEDLDYLAAMTPAALEQELGDAVALGRVACRAHPHGASPPGVRPVIWASWQRSIAAGVDPAHAAYQFVPTQALAEKLATHRQLIRIAAQVMTGLLAYNPRGHINLTDASGTTLYFCGQDLTPIGSQLSEAVQGTSCTGLAIVEDRLVYVLAEENFAHWLRDRRMHCAAAPIRDGNGKTLAVLTLTAEPGWFHFHTLGTVQAAAEAVSRQMALQTLLSEQRTVMEVLNEGLVLLDAEGTIKALNRYARDLFRVTAEPQGLAFETLGRSDPPPQRWLRDSQEVRDLDCSFDLPDGSRLACLLSVCALEEGGRIVSLRENRRIREITRRLIGSQARYTFDSLQGRSRVMEDATRLARIASRSDSITLILGESGTGKELFAQAIHNASARRSGPFVAVNCGAIPRELVQSELFGHVEGAFTGAARGGSAGKFELADGGTLFLDEIGEMSLDAQVSLLRVIQEGEVTRVGAKTSRPVDVRIIAATHRNLAQAVAERAFREDLYYRLNVLSLTVPPLRVRGQDVVQLAEYFLARCARSLRKPLQGIAPPAMELLLAHGWPGNVRELENVIERAAHFAEGGQLAVDDLPADLVYRRASLDKPAPMPTLPGLAAQEADAIAQALRETGGNMRVTAQRLGVSRGGLYGKMKRFGLRVEAFRAL
jgi:transcriptional regulator with PAS, ATPase and Fis domain